MIRDGPTWPTHRLSRLRRRTKPIKEKEKTDQHVKQKSAQAEEMITDTWTVTDSATTVCREKPVE